MVALIPCFTLKRLIADVIFLQNRLSLWRRKGLVCKAIIKHRSPKHADLEKGSWNGDGWDLNETEERGQDTKTWWGEECRLYSINMNMGLDYLKPRWIILFCWLLKLAESGPMLLQVCQILQLILCSRHWIHDPLQLKAGLGPLSAYGAFDTWCDGLSTPVRWSLGKPLAGYPVGARGAIGWPLPQGQVTAWLQFMYIASNIATK